MAQNLIMTQKQACQFHVLRLTLIASLAVGSVIGSNTHKRCSSAEQNWLIQPDQPVSYPVTTGNADMSAESQKSVLPWPGSDWCKLSPCLTVSNAALRAIELPKYQRWLHSREPVNAAPFSPLIYQQQHGTCWRAPERPYSHTLQLRNSSHGLSYGTHFAPLHDGTECSHWVNATGGLLVWYNFFPADNYGHWLHDHATPMYALLELLGPVVSWFALPESSLTRRWLCWFNPELLSRIIFYPVGKCICTNSTTFVSLPNFRGPHGWTVPTGSSVLNSKAFEWHCGGACAGRPAVVFASRSPKTSLHGRLLVNQDEVLDVVRRLMKAYNRPEELVIYTGENVTHADQFQIFSRASLIMGPHGSAMSNVVWAASSKGCKDPVHVVEFIGGSIAGPRVQGGVFGKTYYMLQGGVPWVTYHHLLFESNSTSLRTSVSVQDVEAVLAYIWGGAKSEATHCFSAAWANT